MQKVLHIFWQKWESDAGIIALRIHGENVELKKLSGRDPSPKIAATALLMAWMEIGMEMKELEEIPCRREHGWKIFTREGMSGCKDYTLRYLRDPKMCDIPIGARLHISMYEKLNELPWNGWIGDFLPLIAEAVKNQHRSDEDVEYRVFERGSDYIGSDWNSPEEDSGFGDIFTG